MADPSSSLSARAQQILQRADAQLTALRRPAGPDRGASATAGGEPRTPPTSDDLGQLLDTVEAGIEAARAHLAALAASLDRIAQELGSDSIAPAAPGVEPVAEDEGLPAALQHHTHPPPELGADPEAEPEPEPEPEPAPPAPLPGDPAAAVQRRSSAAHDAARLVAIEMAVAGDTREVVGRRLRNEFGIADPKTILDDVFGPEGGPPVGRRGYGA